MTDVAMKRTSGTIAGLMAVAACVAVSLPSAGPSRGGEGYRASPEARRAKRDAKLARAPKLTAEADAKRARKAAKRLSAVRSSDGSET